MILTKSLGDPETPRLSPIDKGWFCVEMADHRGCVTHINRDGSGVELIARVGKPNGLTVDHEGVIWVAICLPVPSLLRVTVDGDCSMVLDSVEGMPMLLPNDLCFGPGGLLYLTDSGMPIGDWLKNGQVRQDYGAARYDGRVYQIDLSSRTGHILDQGIRFTNGIAFGPDGHLYVNEMVSGDIFRYRFAHGSPTGERELFSNVMTPDWSGGFRGPDGMNFGSDGRLYCTVYGEGNVAVIAPDGVVEKRIKTAGTRPTNLAWGPDGDRCIYVTEAEHGQIEIHPTDTIGLPLYYGGPERLSL